MLEATDDDFSLQYPLPVRKYPYTKTSHKHLEVFILRHRR